MSFPEKPTCKNLSDTKELKKFPAFNSSMLGGNTVTNKDENFAGQGSDSEGTHDVVAHEVNYVGYSHDTANLPGPETPAGDLSTDDTGSGYTPAPRNWKEL